MAADAGIARHTPWLHTPLAMYVEYGIALFAVLLLTGWWTARHSRDLRTIAAAVWAPIGVLAAVAINQPLVAALHEARPYAVLPHALVLLQRTTDPSLPSDHATMAGAATAGLLLVNRRLGITTAIAARASEVLALDVPDLDLRNRRAKVRRKGSAVDVIVWQTGTARLLPRLLAGRSAGPVFLTDRRARLPLAPVDVDRATGRARLSYRRAAELFEEATAGAARTPPLTVRLVAAHCQSAGVEELLKRTTDVLGLAAVEVGRSDAMDGRCRLSRVAVVRWLCARPPTLRRPCATSATAASGITGRVASGGSGRDGAGWGRRQ